MKFSIILPIYNTPNCILKSCFDSVKNQTFKDFELIIVDDGSSEDCKNYIDLISSEVETSKVIHKSNEGVSIARNVGIELAKGEFILFLDSDNTLPNNTLETYLKYSEEYDIVIGQSLFLNRKIENDTDYIDNFDYKNKNEEKIYKLENKFDWKNLVDHILVGKSSVFNYANGYFADGPHGKLFKTEIVKRTMFPKNLKWDEDTVWLLEYFKLCKTGIIIPDFVYNNVSYQYSATKRFRQNCMNEFYDVSNVEKNIFSDYMHNQNAFLYHHFHNILLVARLYFFHPDNNSSIYKKYKEFSNWIKSDLIKKLFPKKQKVDKKFFNLKHRVLIYLLKSKISFLLFVVLMIYNSRK